VFLATAVLAVGWSAVLWDTRFLSVPGGAWDVLKYGFVGAYAFVTGMLIRRFYQYPRDASLTGSTRLSC
jgi:hypothetical protein